MGLKFNIPPDDDGDDKTKKVGDGPKRARLADTRSFLRSMLDNWRMTPSQRIYYLFKSRFTSKFGPYFGFKEEKKGYFDRFTSMF